VPRDWRRKYRESESVQTIRSAQAKLVGGGGVE